MVQNLIKPNEEKNIFQHFFLFSKTTRELSKNVFWTPGYVLGAQKKVWKPKTAKKFSNLGSVPFLGGLQPFTGDSHITSLTTQVIKCAWGRKSHSKHCFFDL